MNAPVHVLSIGSIVGGLGAENREWISGIRELTKVVASSRGRFDSPVRVNIVFQVPGNLAAPDFVGIRTGYFSKKQRLLVVQVALPREVPSDVPGHLMSASYSAIDAAESWAREKGFAENLNSLRAILSATASPDR